MGDQTFSFTAEVWEHAGPAAWFFLSLPEDVADDIEERFRSQARGFGSLRVEVTIGTTTWQTSIFPSNEHETYVLPVKKAVRTARGLVDGSAAQVTLRVLGV